MGTTATPTTTTTTTAQAATPQPGHAAGGWGTQQPTSGAVGNITNRQLCGMLQVATGTGRRARRTLGLVNSGNGFAPAAVVDMANAIAASQPANAPLQALAKQVAAAFAPGGSGLAAAPAVVAPQGKGVPAAPAAPAAVVAPPPAPAAPQPVGAAGRKARQAAAAAAAAQPRKG